MIRTWTPESDTPTQTDAMDYRTVKEWFRKLRGLAEAVDIQREKMTRQRDAATRVTQSFTGMPMTAGNGDKVLNAVCKMDGENRELSRMKNELKTYRMEAISRVFCIVSPEDDRSLRMADALRAYYIECETVDKNGYFKLKTYEDVARELEVSTSTVSESIREGLEVLSEIWQDISEGCA